MFEDACGGRRTTSRVSGPGSSGWVTYHFVGPDGSLCLELRAVPHLECARAAAREEVGDLLPGEVLLFLEVDKELVVFGGEFELWAARALRGRRHSLLANDAGRAMLMGGRRRGALHLNSFTAVLVGEVMMVGGRQGRLGCCLRRRWWRVLEGVTLRCVL